MSKNPNDRPPFQSAWLGFAERRRTSRGTWRLHLRWGRIAVLFSVLFAMLWLGKSFALYYLFKVVRQFEEITFTDTLIFPLNRAELRVRQGDFQIEEARKAIEIGEYRRALNLAQAGVQRSPANLDGRKMLIEFYVAFRRPDLALQLLEGGIPYAQDNVEFIQLYTFLLLREKRDDQMLELAEQLLAPRRDDGQIEEFEKIVALGAMRASASRGYYDQAQEYFDTYQLDDTLEGVRIAADMLNRLNYRAEAIELLEAFVKRFNRSKIDAALALLADYYMQDERYDRAVEVALDRSIRDPLAWPPRMQLLRIYEAAGFDARLDSLSNRLLDEFASDAAAMSVLGQFAADKTRINLARSVYENALENDFDLGIFGLIFIESHLAPGYYDDAVNYCNELNREGPAWLKQYAPQFSAVQLIAHLGLGDSEMGSLYLNELKGARNAPAGLLIATAEKLRAMNRLSEARSLLEEAYLREDNNELALGKLITTEIDLGESRGLTAQVDDLLDLRLPEFSLLEDIYSELNSDRFIFTEQRESLLDEVSQKIEERNTYSPGFYLREVTS